MERGQVGESLNLERGGGGERSSGLWVLGKTSDLMVYARGLKP